jgi:hypothetical protein
LASLTGIQSGYELTQGQDLWRGNSLTTSEKLWNTVDVGVSAAGVFGSVRGANMLWAAGRTQVGAPIGRSLSLAEKLEANAASKLEEFQAAAGPNSHFYSRHGAQTTIEQQWDRAVTGITPDGKSLNPVDSSRFFIHRDQLKAYQRAQELFSRTGVKNPVFDIGYPIGEGFTGGGQDWIKTTNVKAIFGPHGNLMTLYPFIRTLP